MESKRYPASPGFIEVENAQNLYQLCEVSLNHNEIILKILETA